MYRPFTRSTLACAILLASGNAIAHERFDEEIVVTAHPLGDTLFTPSVVDADELRARDAHNVGEAVAGEPGVTLSDFGPGVGQPVIRGLTGARVKVLSDGIGTLDVSTISADHAPAVSVLTAEQVEIYRGPATLLYGSGASGGFVNVRGARIPTYVPESISTRAFAEYDSGLNGYQTAGRLEAGAGNFAILLTGSRRDTGDIDIPGRSTVAPSPEASFDRLASSFVESEDGSIGLAYVSDIGRLGVAMSGFDNRYGVPGKGEPVSIHQQQTRFDIDGEVFIDRLGVDRITTRVGINNHDHAEIEDGAVGTQLGNDAWEGRMEIHQNWLGIGQGVVGAQGYSRTFTASGDEAFVPNSGAAGFGLFALERFSLDALTFELGARYDHDRVKNRATGDNVTEDLFALSGQLAWAFREDSEIGISATHSGRAPTIEERFAFGPHLATQTFEIGDVGLDKERSTNIELFVSQDRGPFSAVAAVFFNHIQDFVYLANTDFNADGLADYIDEADFPGGAFPADRAGLAANANLLNSSNGLLVTEARQANANLYGVEGRLGYALIDTPDRTLKLGFWGDLVQAKLSSGGRVPRMSPARVGFEADYSEGPVALDLDLLKTFTRDQVAQLETTTEGFVQLGIGGRYTRTLGDAEVSIFARGRNLTNAKIRHATSFLKDVTLAPARSVIVGVDLRY